MAKLLSPFFPGLLHQFFEELLFTLLFLDLLILTMSAICALYRNPQNVK